jgi:hypothetical protein
MGGPTPNAKGPESALETKKKQKNNKTKKAGRNPAPVLRSDFSAVRACYFGFLAATVGTSARPHEKQERQERQEKRKTRGGRLVKAAPKKGKMPRLQSRSDATGIWSDVDIGREALADMLSCVICAEEYFSGIPPRIPHATCRTGHTCCLECFERLPRVAPGSTTCPTCRAVTATGALHVQSENGGLLGTLLLRGKMRWVCAADECAAGGSLCAVRVHEMVCERTPRRCPVCAEEHGHTTLARHVREAHADVVRDVRACGAKLHRGTNVMLLPLGCVLSQRRH